MTFDQWVERWQIPEAAVHELQNLSNLEPVNRNGPERSENDVQQMIRVKASQLGCRMWRNNSGAMFNDKGRLVRFGLGNTSPALAEVWKSSDLIGMTGGGRFVACECKTPGWTYKGTPRESAQLAMINEVNSMGGIGFFATSAEDFEGWLRHRS